MPKVNVATLKAELSHYLRAAENGEQIMVVSHGREIAKIVPAYPSSAAEPTDWAAFFKAHPPLKPEVQGEDAATLIRRIRDEE
jgi:prevent-host-death family protein